MICTFLFLPGLLFCQVGEEVQRWLGFWRGDRSTAGVAAWTASSHPSAICFHLGYSCVTILLRARLSLQRQLVTVVQNVLQNLVKLQNNCDPCDQILLTWHVITCIYFCVALTGLCFTCETPFVDCSLLRRFCLLVQAQWDLMLYLSLSKCMEATNSVSTGFILSINNQLVSLELFSPETPQSFILENAVCSTNY